ncbi:hypothetical protein [Leptospira sp. 'Mane']|uniref:hypothetical protein n=1 Tax=Leptospira sp. 'Mane' TaxID=3387407 RepID=UPI00398B8016
MRTSIYLLISLLSFALIHCKLNLNNPGDPRSSDYFLAGILNELFAPQCRVWTKSYGSGINLTMIYDLGVLPNGDLVVIGTTNEPLTGGTETKIATNTPFSGSVGVDLNLYIVRISVKTGVPVWIDYLGKPDNSDSARPTIKISQAGEILVGAGALPTELSNSISPMAGNSTSFLLAKYDQEGKRIWHTYLDSIDLTWPYAFAVDTQNYIHLFLKLNGGNNHSPISEFPSPTNSPSGETAYTDIIYGLLSSEGKPISQQYLQATGSEEVTVAIRIGDSVYFGGASQNSLSTSNAGLHPSPGNQRNFIAKTKVNASHMQETEWSTYVGSSSSLDMRLRRLLEVNGAPFTIGFANDSFGSPAEPILNSGLRNLLYQSFTTKGDSLWHSYIGHSTSSAIEGLVMTGVNPSNSETIYATTIGQQTGEKFLVSNTSIEANQPNGSPFPITNLRINRNTGKFERIFYEPNKTYPVLYYKSNVVQACTGIMAIAYQEIPEFNVSTRGYFTIKTEKTSNLP